MLGLALLAFASRALGITGGLVFDDYLTIEHRTKVNWSSLPHFFTTDQSAIFGSNFYRPLLGVWYEVLYRLCGAHPAAWHLASILLHVACTLLVFRLALTVLEKPVVAWIAAAFFAAHPAHVETIAWASAMGDPLMAAFLLLAVLAFLRWMKNGNILWWVASLIAAAACFLSKEPGVMLPVVLLASAWACPRRGLGKRPTLASVAPFFALALVFLGIRRLVLPAFSHHINSASTAEMISTWPAALLFYWQHMFWPPVVVPFYPLQMVQSWQSPQFFEPLIALILLSGVLGYLLWRAAGREKFGFCLAWILAPLAPTLYLKVFAPFELVHDRFLYTPLIGFCMAAALVLRWATEDLEKRLGSRIYPLLAAALITQLSFGTMSETVWWQNNLTLFTRAVAVTPDNPRALVNLGDAYIAAHRYDEGVPLFQRAIAADPKCSNAMFGLGLIAWNAGDDTQAEAYFGQALRILPRYDLWMYLAKTELRRKRFDQAEVAARQSIAMAPDKAGVHGVMGEVLLAKGEHVEAAREFQEELRFFPESSAARAGLSRAGQ
jgi:tetratricopeptide (TPR) repeat protein